MDDGNLGTEKNSKKLSPLLILGVVVVVVMGGFGILKSKGNNVSQVQPSPAIETTLSGGQSVSQARIVAIEGGNFYFQPNEIKVKKGENVKIILHSVEGIHDFVIDEFSVATTKVSTGQIAEVTFTPDKTGTFEFYCSIGNHRQMGMKGNLVVEE